MRRPDHPRPVTDRARLLIAGLLTVAATVVSAAPALAAGDDAPFPYLGAPLEIVTAASSGAITYGPTVTKTLPTWVALPRGLAARVQDGRMSLRSAERIAGRQIHPFQAGGGARPPLHCQPRISWRVGKITKTFDGRPARFYVAYAAGLLRCWFVINPVPKTGNPPALIQAAGQSWLASAELPKPSQRYRTGSRYDGTNYRFATGVKYAYTQRGRQFRFFWSAIENIVPAPYLWFAAGFGGGPGIKEEHCSIASSDNRDMECLEISHQFEREGD
jgi:hypothetical protein